MQIVIDIPDRLKEVADEFLKINNAGLEELTYFRMNGRLALFCISKGTPLPKGHGDLIDRKDLIENGISKGFCDWYHEIKMADTIIEADEEVQDADSD